jgi:hypothetical protein
MRTTLTIDDDVAVVLERLRKERDASLKDVVNDALRRGLKDMRAPPKAQRKPFRTRTVDHGGFLIPNLDNISEVLAIAEGEDHR